MTSAGGDLGLLPQKSAAGHDAPAETFVQGVQGAIQSDPFFFRFFWRDVRGQGELTRHGVEPGNADAHKADAVLRAMKRLAGEEAQEP